jgi:urease accessory protein UreH
MALFWALGRENDTHDQAALRQALETMASWEGFGPQALAKGGQAFSVTLRSGLFLARALANTLGEFDAFRARAWGLLRPLLLGREAMAPHVWST